ncbi:hypothetical protein LSO9J_360005 [Candidatus Liberibacter solanacearum]
MRFHGMDNVTLYHDKLRISFYSCTVRNVRKSYLDEEVIKESINLIEATLKRYGIDPLSFNIEPKPKNVENYLGNICINKRFYYIS